jgi:hypothetical protein
MEPHEAIYFSDIYNIKGFTGEACYNFLVIEMDVGKRSFTPELIAPCGMNCGICVAHFGYTMRGEKRKHICVNCRSRKSNCAFIKQSCRKLATNKIAYCYECSDFPCDNLKILDKVYRNKYGMSMIENLKYIEAKGIDQFIKNEQERWKCSICGGVICVHNKKCYACNDDRKIIMKPKY